MVDSGLVVLEARPGSIEGDRDGSNIGNSVLQSFLVPAGDSHIALQATNGLHILGSARSFSAGVGVSRLGGDASVFLDVIIRLEDKVKKKYLRIHDPN